jgi:hypothetical protein
LNVKLKNNQMKRFIFSGIILFVFCTLNSQVTKTDVLQNLEKDQPAPADQAAVTTATLTSATRLFKDRDDLTSVIMVIPKDSVVVVLAGSFDPFLHVVFEGNEGYIYARHAGINKTSVPAIPSASLSSVQEEGYGQEARPVQIQADSRYDYLEKKYGTSLASRLYERKIWKGMHSQLVKDSWGSPKKITRTISGNIVKEEWTYGSTWLYFQNSTLTEWGPVK